MPVAPRRSAHASLPSFERVVQPASVSPLVLTCEHACRRMPPGLRLGREHRAILASHWGWDIGAWAMTRDLARRLGASAIGGYWSRLLIDLNRRGDDPTLILRSAGGIALPWNAALSPREIERRVLRIHTPYHNEVDRLVLRRLVRGVRPLLFAVHSFTPVLNDQVRLFDVGVLYGRHEREARLLGRSLKRAGLEVRYNEPYSGLAGMMYAIERHGLHHRLPCLELEFNQALVERRGAIARLGGAVAAGLADLLGKPGARALR